MQRTKTAIIKSTYKDESVTDCNQLKLKSPKEDEIRTGIRFIPNASCYMTCPIKIQDFPTTAESCLSCTFRPWNT